MGTRGHIVIRTRGSSHVFYNHANSFPGLLGAALVRAVGGTSTKHIETKFGGLLDALPRQLEAQHAAGAACRRYRWLTDGGSLQELLSRPALYDYVGTSTMSKDMFLDWMARCAVDAFVDWTYLLDFDACTLTVRTPYYCSASVPFASATRRWLDDVSEAARAAFRRQNAVTEAAAPPPTTVMTDVVAVVPASVLVTLPTAVTGVKRGRGVLCVCEDVDDVEEDDVDVEEDGQKRCGAPKAPRMTTYQDAPGDKIFNAATGKYVAATSAVGRAILAARVRKPPLACIAVD